MSFQLMAWAAGQKTGSPTDKAVLLALANCANHQTGLCCPSVEAICDETEFGSTAVKNALTSLVDKGLIRRERRRRQDGSLGTYEYVFPQVESRETASQEREASVGLETLGVSHNQEDSSNQEEELPPIDPPLGWKVAGKVVTSDEREFAVALLGAWNERVDERTRVSSKEWLAKFVMRHREHPALTLADHEAIIERCLANPWWKGAASPSVIYGSGAQFERSLIQARASPGARGVFEIAQRAVEQARGAA